MEPEEDLIEEEPEEIKELVEKIKFYLNGPEESGIFLGETRLGKPREDVENIFGADYANSGFEYKIRFGDLNLKPGIYTLFIYAYTDKENTKYIIKKININGEKEYLGTKIFVENPKNYPTISPDKITIQGWAINENFEDSTGIDKVEIYLDGTMTNGIFLGDANYGTITREDIGNAFGSQFVQSGYYLEWNAADCKANEDHFLFVYAHTINGDWDYVVSEIYIFDEESTADNFILEIDNALSDFEIEPDGYINITGWAAVFDDSDEKDSESTREN